MKCVAYVQAPADGEKMLEVTVMDPIPVRIPGFDEVLSPQPEAVLVDAEWFDGQELPGYFHLDLEDTAADVLARLAPRNHEFARHGQDGLTLDGVAVSFEGVKGIDGEHVPPSWRDRLFTRAKEVRLAEVTIDGGTTHGRRLLIWGGEHPYQTWLEACRANDEEREAQEVRAKIRRGTHFVNPYTFVPLPDRVTRGTPNGHAKAVEGGLTGYVDASFHLSTPMMLANDFVPEQGGVSTSEQVVKVPGSSVRGAVRSLFEVMTDSCLSVVDPEYLPVHRAPIQMDGKARLAVVTKVENGYPTHVRPTSKVIWIPAQWLHQRFPGHPEGLRSGQRITFDETQIGERSFGRVRRQELGDDGAASIQLCGGDLAPGDWVIHVADAGAKSKHPIGRIFLAAGKLGANDIPLAPGAWDDYRQRCLNSQDVERGQLSNSTPAWSEPGWPGVRVEHVHKPEGGREQHNTVGTRRKSDGALGEGDSIWVTASAGGATALKMAASWRVWGKHPLRDRLPDQSLLPCHDPDDLCPACSLFGFVEQRGGADEKGTRDNGGGKRSEQNAYASHVRFSAFFQTAAQVTIREIHPPPLRSPRPSAGSFYLAHPKAEAPLWESGSAVLGRPASHWGADDPPRKDKEGKPKGRDIAGRKFYWHGQEAGGSTPTPRQVRRDHYPSFGDPKNKDAKRWLMDAGSTLTGRVYFENITRDQLAFLLMALDPGRLQTVTHNVEVAGVLQTHLGGGKPLGFGSATVTLTGAVAEDAAQRYTDSGNPVDPDEILALRAPVPSNAAWLPGLVKVLSSDAVPVERIWYPTLGNFNQRATKDQREKFDASHRFYASFSGGAKPEGAAGVARMRTLPPVDAATQLMSNEYERKC